MSPFPTRRSSDLGHLHCLRVHEHRASGAGRRSRSNTQGRPVLHNPAYCRQNGANQASNKGATMADKSPRQAMTKKSKSIKEKRADKQAKAAGNSDIGKLPEKKR